MATDYFDVVIVGAGLSGIGAAYHLQEKSPDKTYVILEGRKSIGGTWDLFRYPGVRSDSDMHTLGYNFKPWREAKAIADGPSILRYVKETAVDNQIQQHIRTQHLVTKASWSSKEATWTIEAKNKQTGQFVHIRCNFLLMCSGYYSYEHGYTPAFKGREQFKGTIIHPQAWPEEIDYRGKEVIVIGSGATAMTLVPAMAETAENVVMLQRSPTYVVARPDEDRLANFLGKILPDKMAYALTRWKNVLLQQFIYQRSRTEPEKMKQQLINMVRDELGPDYDVEKHFSPRYNPWDQRLCLVPNGDLFAAIRSGKVSIVTDHIDTFTETGLRLQSGQTLEADIIVTATGLDLVVLGGATFVVDGRSVDFSQTFTYKGVMFSDIPNLAAVTGYVNASWTLRADLMAEYVCRLLNYMDKNGFRQGTPRLRKTDRNMKTRPWSEDFTPNYIQRKMHLLPKQGDREPWINSQNYSRDKKMFRQGAIADGVMQFDDDETAVSQNGARQNGQTTQHSTS